MVRKIFSGARIFDGQRFHDDKALIISGGRVEAIAAAGELPDGDHIRFDGGVLSAGFIDAQVNGGGGRMLNDEPSPASMYMIADGHRPYGTTALLPTLITDTADATAAAIEAAKEAVKTNRGVAGLHLEGPHRTGAQGSPSCRAYAAGRRKGRESLHFGQGGYRHPVGNNGC